VVPGRGLVLVAVAVVVVAVAAGLLLLWYHGGGGSKGPLVVFCAGSLKIPLQRVAAVFEKETGVKVYIEPSGSVLAVRKITDLGRWADVLAVADYRLIRDMMLPKYADWYVAFASNEVVLVYTDKSRHHEVLDRDPSAWMKVLAMPDVRFGFSNPNMDPCGYRAAGIIALAGLVYHREDWARRLLGLAGIRVVYHGNGTVDVYVPASLRLANTSRLVVRPKSVDLISMVEDGELDYAFEYISVARQHGLRYVRLGVLGLGDPSRDGLYSRVRIHLLYGTSKEKTLTLKSIVYGITVPKCARHPGLALRFVELVLGPTGRRIFAEAYQPELQHPFYGGRVPPELLKLLGG